jgi:putative ABC transport system permease protein
MLDVLRQCLRFLRGAPGLAAISVVTVGMGIGAGTSLFTVIKAVLLNPLPYPAPDRLVWISEVRGQFKDNNVSFPDFDDFRTQGRSFSEMAAYSIGTATLGEATPENGEIAGVSDQFFGVMGVWPALGRSFSEAEQRAPAATVVILSHNIWQRLYGGDRAILGRTIRFNGVGVTVIGVMPPRFGFPDETDAWLPLYERTPSRTAHNYRVVGRLRSGVSIDEARAEISAIAQRLKQQYPNPFQNPDANVVSLYSHLVGAVRPALLVLFAAVGFLLLIVCVNVANLLLAQISARERELAIRAAIGATRWRLVRQMLGESMVLAITGGALGCLLAAWTTEVLRILLPAAVPRASDVRIDSGVLVFALALAAATGLFFGALPAWRASRSHLNEKLRAGSRSYTASRQSHRTQAALIISEVALALLLVAGAGLLIRSFSNLRAVDPGFRAGQVLTATLTFPENEDRALIGKYRELLRQVRAIPGVQAAGYERHLPLGRFHPDGNFVIENRRELKNADANYSVVSPGYFTALRIPLLHGRDLTEADSEAAPAITIINTEMGRVYFPGIDPLGQRIWFPSFVPDAPLWLTIVGIVPNVRQQSLVSPVRPEAFVCYAQIPHVGTLEDGTLVVRTASNPAGVAPAVRSRLRSIDRGAAVSFQPMDSLLAEATARQRFQMQILAAFAALALLLAAVGLYGVLCYTVTSRRNEIGIRLALGAQRTAVYRTVTVRALGLYGAGTALGLIAWLAIRRLLTALLFGIGPTDPGNLAIAAALLLVVTLSASWLPARRATRIDPVSALREE